MEITRKQLGRAGYGFVALLGLGLIYIFQYTDFLLLISATRYKAEYHFISNRLVRILVNDICMMVLIYAIFDKKSVLKLAFMVQLVDLLILLPLYLGIKLHMEGTGELSSPFLAQFHRLIVNPTLMILLIPAIFYQKLMENKG